MFCPIPVLPPSGHRANARLIGDWRLPDTVRARPEVTLFEFKIFSGSSAFRAVREPVVLGGDIQQLPAGIPGCDAFGVLANPPRFIAPALSA
jgi:hypothetical protein